MLTLKYLLIVRGSSKGKGERGKENNLCNHRVILGYRWMMLEVQDQAEQDFLVIRKRNVEK